MFLLQKKCCQSSNETIRVFPLNDSPDVVGHVSERH